MNVRLPELGEGIAKATVACWHFKIGDRIKQGDDLVEVATDKAIFNVASKEDGIVKEILVQEGEDIAVGETLAIVDKH